MLNHRSGLDRRQESGRRTGGDRRLQILPVANERRIDDDRRSAPDRRIYSNRRGSAMSFRDIM